jgi:hypothetical protein
MITSRYLFFSLLINDFFFLSFLSWTIFGLVHFPEGLQISEKNANGEKKKKNVHFRVKVSNKFSIGRFQISE